MLLRFLMMTLMFVAVHCQHVLISMMMTLMFVAVRCQHILMTPSPLHCRHMNIQSMHLHVCTDHKHHHQCHTSVPPAALLPSLTPLAH